MFVAVIVYNIEDVLRVYLLSALELKSISVYIYTWAEGEITKALLKSR